MPHPNVDILRGTDDAMSRGDVEAFFSYYTDDVAVHIGGRSSMAGDYKGKDQLMGLFGQFMEKMGNYTFDNHAYLADDEHGIILQRSSAEKGGKSLELQEVFVMHFRDGKISEFWYVPTDQAAFDAFIG